MSENPELEDDDKDREFYANQMNSELEEASTVEAKLEVLKRYMSESMALDALGLILGNHQGDVIDTTFTR